MAVYRQTGKMPAQLADAPALPEHCADAWGIFLALHASRGSNGFGPSRITFADMDSYQRVTGDRLSAWTIAAIQSADSAFMASIPVPSK